MTDVPQWTCIAEVVPGLEGTGLVFADPAERQRVVDALSRAGYAIASFDGSEVSDFRQAQRLVAEALRLPPTAGRNLDALADSLRDLSDWPGVPRLALLWDGAETLISRDLSGWFRLTQVLAEATDDLWRGLGDPGDRLFETVLFVRGFGVSEA